MKCRICARECPPGAKICRDCAAARKRAFAATVTQPLLAAAGAPSVGQPRFAPRPSRPRPARNPAGVLSARSDAAIAASAVDRVAAPRRLGVQWLLLGLAIAAALVYLLVRMLTPDDRHATDDAAISGDAASRVSTPAPSAIAAQPPDAGARSAAALAEAAAAPGVKANSAIAGNNAAPKAKGRKAASKVEAAKVPPPEPAAATPEPVPAPRSPPPRAAETPRDPWQVMNEGLSRCAREDWLSRGACEQRLRLQYCANYWGSVPQCPIGPATDHGQ